MNKKCKSIFENTNDDFDNLVRLDTESVLNRPTLKLGDQGEYVNLLQTQLKQLKYFNDNITGYFGNITFQSVKDFQALNDLTVDGIVGKDTWSALIDLYSPLLACETNYHIVQAGETLWSIARKYNTSVDELKRLNNLTSNTLTIGQQLAIPGTQQPPPSENIIYTVQPGDSLWSIANKYNTSVDTIKNYNNLTSNVISIGQQLIIPSTQQPPPSEETVYTVQPGDSLWSIANKYNTSVDAIKDYNNLTSNILMIGQQLIIPTTTTPPEYTTYTVQPGDSLWSIANKYNTSVDAIKRLNNLTSNLLNIGDVLKIPI